MQRLLHEGMDAGLCGFSIQRLGRNSTQADFDGTPMVTDTMCDEDILALAEVLAERDEGFIQITQATGDIKARPRVRREARRGRPSGRSSTTPSPPPAATPTPHRKSLRLAASAAGTRACRSTARAATVPRRLRLHARALEPLRLLARRGGRSPPAPTRRSWRRWPTRRCARRWWPRRDAATRPSTASCGPASAARSRSSSCRASPASRSSQQYVGQLARPTSPRRRASTPSR